MVIAETYGRFLLSVSTDLVLLHVIRAESKFKLVADSFKILDSPELKQHYDTFADLTAIGNSARQRHWIKINRPNQLLPPPPT